MNSWPQQPYEDSPDRAYGERPSDGPPAQWPPYGLSNPAAPSPDAGTWPPRYSPPDDSPAPFRPESRDEPDSVDTGPTRFPPPAPDPAPRREALNEPDPPEGRAPDRPRVREGDASFISVPRVIGTVGILAAVMVLVFFLVQALQMTAGAD